MSPDIWPKNCNQNTDTNNIIIEAWSKEALDKRQSNF